MTLTEIKNKFCCNVSERRLHKNMSLEELSVSSGVPLKMLEVLERGEIPEEMMVDDAFHLADVFGCKVYELFQ